MFGGQSVQELYVRRRGQQLQLGYAAAVHWNRSSKTIEAGWLVLEPATPRQSITAESDITDAANSRELMDRYGIPDEARQVFPFEVAGLVDEEAVGELQLVRYGNHKIILSRQGRIQDIAPQQKDFRSTRGIEPRQLADKTRVHDSSQSQSSLPSANAISSAND